MQSREENNINVLMRINDYLTKEEKEIYNNAISIKDIPSKHKAIMLREKRARYLKAINDLNELAKKYPDIDAAKNWNMHYKHFAFQTIPQLIMISKILEDLKNTHTKIYEEFNNHLCEAMLARLKLIATEGHDDVVFQSMKEFKVKKAFIEKFQKTCPLRNSFPKDSASRHHKNMPINFLNDYIVAHGSREQKNSLLSIFNHEVPLPNGIQYFHILSDNNNDQNNSIDTSWLRLPDQQTKVNTSSIDDLAVLNEEEKKYILELCEAKVEEKSVVSSNSVNSSLLNEIKKLYTPFISSALYFIPYANTISRILFSTSEKTESTNKNLRVITDKPREIPNPVLTVTTPENISSKISSPKITLYEFSHYYRIHLNCGFFHRHGQNGKNNAAECLRKFDEYSKIHINPIDALKDVMVENTQGNYYHHSFKTYLLAYYQYLSKPLENNSEPQDFFNELLKKSPSEIKALYKEITQPTTNKMTSEHYLAFKM